MLCTTQLSPRAACFRLAMSTRLGSETSPRACCSSESSCSRAPQSGVVQLTIPIFSVPTSSMVSSRGRRMACASGVCMRFWGTRPPRTLTTLSLALRCKVGRHGRPRLVSRVAVCFAVGDFFAWVRHDHRRESCCEVQVRGTVTTTTSLTLWWQHVRCGIWCSTSW